MKLVIPITTVSEANRRDHWGMKAQRVRNQRCAVYLFLKTRALPILPVKVKLTRLAPRLLDDDNAVGSLKAVRDEIAALYNLSDRDENFAWKYGQERAKEPGVRIEIQPVKLAQRQAKHFAGKRK